MGEQKEFRSLNGYGSLKANSNRHCILLLVLLYWRNGLTIDEVADAHDSLDHTRYASYEDLLDALRTDGLAEVRSGKWFPSKAAISSFGNSVNNVGPRDIWEDKELIRTGLGIAAP